MIAIVLQLLQVVLQDGILPHASVHSRREEHWGFRGHDGSVEHIVADTVCHLTDNIGSTGGNQEKLTLLGQRHVFHIEVEIAVEGIDDALVVGECLEGHRGDKVGGVLRHDDVNVGIQLHQHRGQIGDLIGSDASRDSQNDGFSC